MLPIEMKGRSVLITGGTKGIGLAAALKFAQSGAQTFLTYKWGSYDEIKLFRLFEETGGPPPVLLQADVSVDEDTDNVLDKISQKVSKIDIFISNVGYALRTPYLKDYKKKSFFKTLEYSSWPIIEYTRKIEKKFSYYPKYIIGVSSDGPDHYYKGYDFVAGSKAVLEFFAKYLSVHLFEHGSRVNVIRFGNVKTESFELIFGDKFFKYLEKNGVSKEMILTPEQCGDAILALCSGLMDAMNGQIINVDNGLPFRDNAMMNFLKENG